MMRNPFAINNGDLDGGDARERRDNDERRGIAKNERAGGWPSRENAGKEVV